MSFFSRLKCRSVTEAKERLKSVIKSDRINTSDNVTMEEIRKDVTAVLMKYAQDRCAVRVNVSIKPDEHISLDAVFTVKSAV